MGYSVVKISDEQGEAWFLWSSYSDRPVTGAFTKKGMLARLLWEKRSDSWEAWLADGRETHASVNAMLLDIFERLNQAQDAEEGGFIAVNCYGENEEALPKDAFLAKLRAHKERPSLNEREIIHPWCKWLIIWRTFQSASFEPWMSDMVSMMGRMLKE